MSFINRYFFIVHFLFLFQETEHFALELSVITQKNIKPF